jgi:Tfp pilus assembly protein PilN
MLQINLLPPYINAGAKRRNVMLLWGGVLAAVIGGLIFFQMTINAETERIRAAQADIEDEKALALSRQQEANNITSASEAVRTRAKFVRDARTHTETTYQEVVRNIAQYTWPRVLYDGINPQGQSVAINAYAPTLTDVGRYMIWMERNPQISNVAVSMNSIPPFPSGGQQQAGANPTGIRPLTGGGHDFQVALTLVNPIPAGPTHGGGGGAPGGGGGAPGFGFGGGGMGGGPPGGMSGGMGGGPPGGMSGGMRGGPPGGMSGGMGGPPGGRSGGM